MKTNVPSRTRKLRNFILIHKGKTYRDMAKEIGISDKTIYNYVNGYSSCSVDNVEAILNSMGYSLAVRKLTT